MKKFLALFLVVAMLISTLAILSSCGLNNNKDNDKDNGETETEKPTTSEKDAKKDPLTTLMMAASNTTTNFFVTNKDAKKLLTSNSNKASASVEFEDTKDIMPGFKKLSYSYYADLDDKFFASKQNIKLDDQAMNYDTYVDMKDKNIIIAGDAFGKNLKVNLDTLPDQIKSSELLKMTGLTEDTAMVDLIVNIAKEVKEILNTSDEDALKIANEYLAIFLGEISEEKLEVNGKKIDCVKMPFTIDKNSIGSFIDKAVESIPALSDFEEFEEAKNEIIEEMDEALVGSKLELTVYISKEDIELEKIDINVKVGTAIFGGDEALKVNGEIVFTDDKIALTGSTAIDDNEYSLNVEIAKETKDKVTTFTASGKAAYSDGNKEATIKLFEATASYDEKSGDVKLEVKIPEAETELAVNGNFKVESKKAIFTVTSASAKYVQTTYPEIYYEEFDMYEYDYENPITENVTDTFDFNLVLTLDTDPETVSAPKDAVDVMTLTKKELEELGNSMNEAY